MVTATGRVVGFSGLTLEPTSHVLEVDARRLYAWCALDTLFLPELLGREDSTISPRFLHADLAHEAEKVEREGRRSIWGLRREIRARRGD